VKAGRDRAPDSRTPDRNATARLLSAAASGWPTDVPRRVPTSLSLSGRSQPCMTRRTGRW
jgi:hypothetical protein